MTSDHSLLATGGNKSASGVLGSSKRPAVGATATAQVLQVLHNLVYYEQNSEGGPNADQ
jgi:hypothetical protein